MSDFKYNTECEQSKKMLEAIQMVCDNIKINLHKKEYEIHERLLQRLHQATSVCVQHFNNELEIFKRNDSDNEDAYSDSARNCNDDDEVDSVSEYDTDTDNEENKKEQTITQELLLQHDNQCIKLIDKMKEELCFEIKKN